MNVLTHCNAGWLATVDWGTALAPVYAAFTTPASTVHVWVDETRPKEPGGGADGVGARQARGAAHGRRGQRRRPLSCSTACVDLVIVGADRVTRTGDAANKIGTYLKALAAWDNGIPFWVASPSSTIDWTVSDGVAEIPIEERDAAEVTTVTGRGLDGKVATVRVTPTSSPAANPAFDVTPARLVTGLITERGRCAATPAGLAAMFPERA